MKSIKNVILMIMLSVCFCTCHNEYQPVPTPPTGIGFDGNVNFQSWYTESLSTPDRAVKFISLSGPGYSNVPEFGYFSMEGSHVLFYDDNEDKIYIRDGKFRINGAGKIALTGIYKGTGSCKEEMFLSELEFTIQGGEINFRGATGTFTGTLRSSSLDPESLNLDFNGRIITVEQE